MSLEAGLRLISEAQTHQLQEPHSWSTRRVGESLVVCLSSEAPKKYAPPSSHLRGQGGAVTCVDRARNQPFCTPSTPTWIKKHYRWTCSWISVPLEFFPPGEAHDPGLDSHESPPVPTWFFWDAGHTEKPYRKWAGAICYPIWAKALFYLCLSWLFLDARTEYVIRPILLSSLWKQLRLRTCWGIVSWFPLSLPKFRQMKYS